jgi:hypothetical protein
MLLQMQAMQQDPACAAVAGYRGGQQASQGHGGTGTGSGNMMACHAEVWGDFSRAMDRYAQLLGAGLISATAQLELGGRPIWD